MFCKKCGEMLIENAEFCGKCGHQRGVVTEFKAAAVRSYRKRKFDRSDVQAIVLLVIPIIVFSIVVIYLFVQRLI